MTHITLPRATVEQALEAMKRGVPTGKITLYEWDKAMAELTTALAQQAEPVIDPFNCPKCGRHDYGLYGACPTCDAQHIDLFGYQGPSRRTRAAAGQTSGCDHCNHPLYAATKCRVCGRVTEQAEPVEPVAWSGYDLDGMVEAFSRVIEAHYQRANPFQNPVDMDAQMALRILRGFIPAMKAYTAPPQRKPLTEEEIDAMWRKASECAGKSEGAVTTSQFVQMFARAVERALEEKNRER